ncbi:DUF4258 domain-containing protein [Methylophilus aquaticus]|uniref:DUF4258 domain-containing protein n=2 Tax=Methylophilus aquaticus TaxID=1971610 RepID=A0ABT9JWH8_9PROT|nr:DUF4258 domain-containing protein [Methylophilus aquaticus]
MHSKRFSCSVRITHHARERMSERNISESLILDLIETGEIRKKDEVRLWIFKSYTGRNDNLLCVAVVLETCLVVKTVMHHFELEQ